MECNHKMDSLTEEFNDNQEFIKTFWQPDHMRFSTSAERIHLFPNSTCNAKIMHDNHVLRDFSERSCACLKTSPSESSQDGQNCSEFKNHSQTFDDYNFEKRKNNYSSLITFCSNANIAYPDVANFNFKGSLNTNVTNLSCDFTAYRKAMLMRPEGNCKTIPMEINKCRSLEIETKKRKFSRSDFKKLLNDKKSFILLSIAVFITGTAAGLVAGLIMLTGLQKKSVRCSGEEMVCLPLGCISKSSFCSGMMKGQCNNLSDRLEDVCIANSDVAKEVWNELQNEIHKSTITKMLPQKFGVSEKDKAGWIYFSNGSSNGSKYIVINKLLTFYGAQDQCRKLGGHLAHVNSIREQIFLEDYLNNELKNEQGMQGSIGFWLGARRPRGGHSGSCMFDQWKWVDSYGRSHGAIKGFTAFMPGKPDNTYNPEECLYMAHNKGIHGNRLLKWDDAPCDLHSFGGIKSVCEVELP